MTYSSLAGHLFMPNLMLQMGQIRNKKLLRKIAVVVKQLRAERDLSQSDVFDETSIHVGRIETAQSNPTVSTMAALCDYFNIPQSEFYKKVEAVK
jgi:DNA-binding XRE family transcriptional regulator